MRIKSEVSEFTLGVILMIFATIALLSGGAILGHNKRDAEVNNLQLTIDSLQQAIVAIPSTDTIYAVNWNAFIEALIWVESRGNDSIVGDNGKSIGCLQIQETYVDYLNDFRNGSFDYDDRYSRQKSLDMFNLMNPEKDILLALKRHNPRAESDYYAKIFVKMFAD